MTNKALLQVLARAMASQIIREAGKTQGSTDVVLQAAPVLPLRATKRRHGADAG